MARENVIIPPLPPLTKVVIASPFPPHRSGFHGGTQVIARLIDDLAETHSVGVVYLRAPGEPPIEAALAERCFLVEEVARLAMGLRRQLRLFFALTRGRPMWVEDWRVPAFARKLREVAIASRPHVVQFEFHIMAQYAAALDHSAAATLLVVHEPGAETARERHHASQGVLKLLWARNHLAWSPYERVHLPQFDAIACFTSRDRDQLLALHPSAKIAVIPPRGPAPRQRMQLVGDSPPPVMRQLAGPQIQIPGRVPEVATWLQAATVFAAPLAMGGRIRVKTMDALAFCKAVVASPLACAGLSVRHGHELLQATTDEASADALLHLLGNAQERERLGTNALARAADFAAPGRAAARFAQLYRTARKLP